MNKIVLALVCAPGVALAQVPVYPQGDPAPLVLDPGAAPSTPRPAPPPQAPKPAAPAVIVVGPDGKVLHDSTQPAQPDPSAGYYTPPGETAGFGYDEEPTSIYTGPTPELHVVRTGDTLWGICSLYFNDPWQWPKVWSYNPQITNPHWIYPGDLVRLLPKGMFVESRPVKDPEQRTAAAAPPDRLPAPQQRAGVALKQVAFVEKSDLDRSITVDGSVDEKELLSLGDSIYLAYPPNNPPKVGQRYSVYRPDNAVKSGGKEVGSYVRILGAVEIVSVKQDKRARGVIVEANHEIERGAKVGPLVKQYTNVTPVPPKADAQGSIIAILTRDFLIGQGEIVFVDLGAKSGVEVGNRMFVVRRGDALPPVSENTVGQDDRRFPARALGEVVIVEVGKNISVALVTLAVQEMSVGDLVMMQKAE